MKSALLLFLALGLALLPLRAEDWTTTTGETYKNVKVLSHDAAYVTILHQDGGGKILLSTLSPDVQKRFGYDPVKAAQAIAAAAAADEQNRIALAKEKARIEAAREQFAAEALTAALFLPPPDADIPAPGTPNNPTGSVADTGYPPDNSGLVDTWDYGDWGYGGYGYGYPGYGYTYGGYRTYGNYGDHSGHGGGGWSHSSGTRGFSPGARSFSPGTYQAGLNGPVYTPPRH